MRTESPPDQATAVLQGINPVLQFAIVDRRGADDERTVRNRIRDGPVLLRIFQQRRRTNRRPRFAKRNLVGVDYTQMQETKIAHRASGRTQVERISRGDQNNTQAVEFRSRGQRPYFTMRKSIHRKAVECWVNRLDGSELSPDI